MSTGCIFGISLCENSINQYKKISYREDCEDSVVESGVCGGAAEFDIAGTGVFVYTRWLERARGLPPLSVGTQPEPSPQQQRPPQQPKPRQQQGTSTGALPVVTLPPNSLQHPLQPQLMGPSSLPPVGPPPPLACYLPPGGPPSLRQYPYHQLLPSCGPMGVPMWTLHAEPHGAPFGGQRGIVDKDLHKLIVRQWQEPRAVLMYILQGRFVAPLAAAEVATCSGG